MFSLETIFHTLVSLAGLLISAYVLVWCACKGMELCGYWPDSERRKSRLNRLSGHPAKHNWHWLIR